MISTMNAYIFILSVLIVFKFILISQIETKAIDFNLSELIYKLIKQVY